MRTDLTVRALTLDAITLARIDSVLSRISRRRRHGFVRVGRGVRQQHLAQPMVLAIVRALLRRTKARRCLHAAARAFTSAAARDFSIGDTTAWLNVARPGEFHDWHRHTGAHLSSVLFLDSRGPDRGGALQFRDVDSGRPSRRLTVFPRAGLLLLFPAVLEHRTRPVGHGRRRSLAIDFYWRAT